MDNQKFNLILDRLLQRTEEKKLDWKATANENTFLTVLKDSSISISHGYDEYELGEGYIFDFRNENGETVASIHLNKSGSNEVEFKKAQKIFELASQNSFLNNKTIDRILEQLAA